MRNKVMPFAALLILTASAFSMPMAAYAAGLPGEIQPPAAYEILRGPTEDAPEESVSSADAYKPDNIMNVQEPHSILGVSDAELSESAIPQSPKQEGDPSSADSSPPADDLYPADGLRPFTPDGQATVTDRATEYDGKEFYTFTTPAGNVFYLIIDHARASGNVYFLGAVTESDLISLAEKAGEPVSESAIPITADPTPGPAFDEPAEDEPDGGGVEPQAEENSGGGNGMIIFIVVAALALGGTGYYVKIVRPKQQAANSDDDDYEDEPEDGEDDRDYLYEDSPTN